MDKGEVVSRSLGKAVQFLLVMMQSNMNSAFTLSRWRQAFYAFQNAPDAFPKQGALALRGQETARNQEIPHLAFRSFSSEPL